MSMKRNFEEAATKCREYQDKNDQLAEKMAAFIAQIADADKQVGVLSQTLEAAKAELKACQDKIVFLADENKVILQEKAMIHGKFKQLQDSL